ncbi:hypothetical protein NMG60_11021288 [Bertholletia excelsa]
MSKLRALFTVVLLFFAITCSARREPSFHNVTTVETQHVDVGVDQTDDSCVGVGEEECLMRRTLAAHLDYIYTQKQKQP